MCDLAVEKHRIIQASVKKDIKEEFELYVRIIGLELESTDVLNVLTILYLIIS